MAGTALILFVATILRLWRIDTLPPGFHFDESFEGMEAWRILTDPGYRPVFLMGNFGVPPLNAYANALMFGLFQLFGGEAGPTAMRTTAAVFGVLGVVSVWALARELCALDGPMHGLSAAFPLFAAGALAVMRWHVHFSRMGIEPVIVPLIWAAAMWLFLRGWRTGSLLSFAGSGVVLAAGMYTYQGAWVIPLLMVPVVGVLLVQQKLKIEDSRLGKEGSGSQDRSGSPIFNLQSSVSRRLWGSAITAGVAFLLFLPLAFFFLRNVDLVFLRPTQLAVVGETGSPADSSVWSSVWRTLAMFWPLGQTGDLDPRRNLPGAPALDVWLALPFFAGLALALWRVRRPAYSIVLIGWIGLLLPGMVSEYAPHFHRILGAAAPTALLIGMGLDWLWGRATLRRWRLHWLVPALLVLSLVTTARDYFVRWAALPDLYYAFDQGFWEIGQWKYAEPSTPRPSRRAAKSHTTLAFAWRTLPADAPGDLRRPPDFPADRGHGRPGRGVHRHRARGLPHTPAAARGLPGRDRGPGVRGRDRHGLRPRLHAPARQCAPTCAAKSRAG
ncbi:MAG: glycosyltransferase family 39 protein [Caldilineaceae bacterium]